MGRINCKECRRYKFYGGDYTSEVCRRKKIYHPTNGWQYKWVECTDENRHGTCRYFLKKRDPQEYKDRKLREKLRRKKANPSLFKRIMLRGLKK